MNKTIKIDEEKLMEDKLCLVTGASRGIGYHIALGLAQMGAFVILVGHNQKRGENASRRINAFAMKDTTDFILADLSSQEQIRMFTEKFKKEYDHLDVLVNNAGGFFLKRRESVDGIEMTFALNHMNYFSTTLLLLKHLLAGNSSRIVNVSSESHRGEEMNFDDLQYEDDYNGLKAYGQSKLANVLFTTELSRRLLDTDVTVNALHPGFIKSNLGKQNELVRIIMNMMHFLFAKSPQKGAQTPIYLASSPEVEDITGKYFIDKKPVRPSREARDPKSAGKLWEVSKELSGMDISRTGLGNMPARAMELEKEAAEG